jgi:hypothetical protein
MLTNSEIAHRRLYYQGLSKLMFKDPTEVVTKLGAVQAQDYAGAKWALGQRVPTATDAAIDQVFNEGKILRTHLMRPTWHFVVPANIRWMLDLTAARVHAVNAFMYRKLELEKAIIKKSYKILEKALQGNNYSTRAELASIFDKTGILADGLRMGYFLMSAELDGILCSGPRKGKQFTYALLEERVPQVKTVQRDEALAELTKRYFATRGPATLQDFTWWSGLTMADAKKGLEMVQSQFMSEVINNHTYWFVEATLSAREKSPTAYLLPNYDEYFIGFKDRSAIGEVAAGAGISSADPSFLAHIIIVDGQVVGGWRRTLKKNAVLVELNLITSLTKSEHHALREAANRYGKFLGLQVDAAEVNEPVTRNKFAGKTAGS